MNYKQTLQSDLHGHSKVTADHLHRRAYIYIRQSSLGQVLSHKASQFNQLQMVERARQLGWSSDQIYIIETDQGTSASGALPRSGFQELVAEVSLGRVGIILGYEVSRLARNNSDWYRLLDVATLFDTLIADYDGVYNLHLFNDRLLLGLKGTMSEAELHLFRLRMQAGRMRLVERGEYRLTLPTGLVRLDDGTVVQDPDDQVRAVLRLVFEKFDELGSTYRVTRYLRQHAIQLPRRQMGGEEHGQTLWKAATQAVVYSILRNPAYGGAFVFGRHQVDPTRRREGQSRRGVTLKPMEEWDYVQPDVYPGYISWEQYQANQQRLHQNQARFEAVIHPQGVPRRGSALLQGLAVCGHCGQRLWVAYKSTPRYVCNRSASQAVSSGDGAAWRSFHGPSVDEVVVHAFFQALQPAQLDALAAVLEQQQVERRRQLEYWKQQLQRAEYEAHRTQRQYNAVEPENRLVAAELERRWEAKLVQLQAVRQSYEDAQHTPTPILPPLLRQQFQHICEALPQLWQTSQLDEAQRKSLLRSLISRVVLTQEASDTIGIRLVWVSGHYSQFTVRPPVFSNADLTDYDQLVEQVEALWKQGDSDEQIAHHLTQAGFRAARYPIVSRKMVQNIRLKHGWRRIQPQNQRVLEVAGFLTVQGVAARLGVNREWVRHRIRSQQLDPKYVQRHPQRDMILIQDCPEVMDFLRRQLSSQSTS
jgi:DNA invertase Pin-like site-specific DNA recombinase